MVMASHGRERLLEALVEVRGLTELLNDAAESDALDAEQLREHISLVKGVVARVVDEAVIGSSQSPL
jgi:hypothetical protein